MDGNGRWAAARWLGRRAEGHRATSRRCVASSSGQPNLAFSIDDFLLQLENCVTFPDTEIGDLFGLLRRFIRKDLATLHRDGSPEVRVIGQRDRIGADICALLKEARTRTRITERLNMVVAFKYGSRQEIASAAQRLRASAEGKRDPASIVPTRSASISMSTIFPTRSDHSHQRKHGCRIPDVQAA